MRHSKLMKIAVLAIFAVMIVATSPAIAASKTKGAKGKPQTPKNDRVILYIGPTIDLGGGVLYFPLGSKPVVFNKEDVGKPQDQIGNQATLARIEKINADTLEAIGTSENAELMVDSALPPTITGEVRNRIVEDFVNGFNEAIQGSPRGPIVYQEATPCGYGDVCPGVCGTRFPEMPQVCYTNLACIDCGRVPK